MNLNKLHYLRLKTLKNEWYAPGIEAGFPPQSIKNVKWTPTHIEVYIGEEKIKDGKVVKSFYSTLEIKQDEDDYETVLNKRYPSEKT